MVKKCRICKCDFRNNKEEITICDDCLKAIIYGLKENEEVLTEFGKELFKLDVGTIGIGDTGTIDNIFRKEANQKPK